MPPNPSKVASLFLFGAEYSPAVVEAMRSDYEKSHKGFTYVILEEKPKPPYLRSGPRLGAAWVLLARAGKRLVNWITNTRSIPPNKAKKTEIATRLFMSVSRTRDVIAWYEKNKDSIDLLLEATNWPERGAGGKESELFTVGGFKVHNTIALAGKELEATKGVVERAQLFLKKVPAFRKVVYGDVFIVGKLKQPKVLAWYSVSSDDVYLRPHPSVNVDDVETLLHELAHRWWNKFANTKLKIAWNAHHDSIRYSGKEPIKFPEVGEEFPVNVQGYKTKPRIIAYKPSYIEIEGGGRVPIMALHKLLQKKRDISAYPTPYASTDPQEHFSEAFARYLTGHLKDDHEGSFKRIVVDQLPEEALPEVPETIIEKPEPPKPEPPRPEIPRPEPPKPEPKPEPPAPPAPPVTPSEDPRLALLRDLWKAARMASDDWTMNFVKSLADQIKAKKPLTPKQTNVVMLKFKHYKIDPGTGW